MNNKFLINSLPRTATTWLQFLLCHLLKYEKNTNQCIIQNWNPSLSQVSTRTEYSESFVIKMHNPIGLYARYDDIKQIYICRNPIDNIASIVTKTMGGIGQTVVNGIPMPSEYPAKFSIESNIQNEIGMYKSYATAALDNIDKLKIYTFDSIVNDIENVINDLFNNEYYISNFNIPKALKLAQSWIHSVNLGHVGYANGLPSEKPVEYYKALKILKNINLEEINYLYDCLKKQSSC